MTEVLVPRAEMSHLVGQGHRNAGQLFMTALQLNCYEQRNGNGISFAVKIVVRAKMILSVRRPSVPVR